MRTIVTTVLFAIGLSGCTAAEWDSINRPFNPSHGDSRLIDAKQRAIISINRPVLGADGTPVYDNKNKPVLNLAICAEPSPDALQATATALAGAGTSDAAKAAVNLSLSTSGSAASIGLRTQAIQLLRDAYYRLCEAYMNDGLDAIAYDVLQRRYQNQIIALLAVEQLTGTVTAQQAALNTTSSSDAGAQAGLISRQIFEAEERKTALKQQVTDNETTIGALDVRDGEINTDIVALGDADADKLQKKTLEGELARNKSTRERLLGQNQNIVDEQGRLDGQITNLNTALTEASKKTINSSAAATSSLSGGNATSRSNIETQVANAVRAITLNAINQDYEAQVCFESLRYRNHVNQFKNDVNTVFKPVSDPSRLKKGEQFRVDGGAFLKYCQNLFVEQVHARQHRAHIVKQRAAAIQTIVGKVGTGTNGISAAEAATLLLALEQSSTLTPGAAFLPKSFEAEANGKVVVEINQLLTDDQKEILGLK